MREINCDICGKLVFSLAKGSIIHTGSKVTCRRCNELLNGTRIKTESCEVVDDLFKMFGRK